MGKKSKGKRRKYNYNKAEFKNNVCTRCKLCSSGTNPLFCYEDVYLSNPKKFINTIFKNLIDVKHWLINIGKNNTSFLPDKDIEYIFKIGFCASNYCKQRPSNGDSCKYLAGCIAAFRNQIKNPNAQLIQLNEYRIKKKNKHKKSKKAKIIRHAPKPYPTFFCRKGMEKEIKRIVNGNNIK